VHDDVPHSYRKNGFRSLENPTPKRPSVIVRADTFFLSVRKLAYNVIAGAYAVTRIDRDENGVIVRTVQKSSKNRPRVWTPVPRISYCTRLSNKRACIVISANLTCSRTCARKRITRTYASTLERRTALRFYCVYTRIILCANKIIIIIIIIIPSIAVCITVVIRGVVTRQTGMASIANSSPIRLAAGTQNIYHVRNKGRRVKIIFTSDRKRICFLIFFRVRKHTKPVSTCKYTSIRTASVSITPCRAKRYYRRISPFYQTYDLAVSF